MKFLTFGTDTSILSSVGDSFFIIKHALYHTSKVSKVTHSHKDTCWSHSIINIIAVTHNRKSQSLYTNFFCINTGVAMAEIHRIIHKLNIFDHMIFQIDSDQLHWTAAIHDKNNSGAEVQMASIVNHINKSDTLKCLAILTLVFIKWFAEKTNKYKPTISVIIANIIHFILIIKLFLSLALW